jgi:hypothetical protein
MRDITVDTAKEMWEFNLFGSESVLIGIESRILIEQNTIITKF